MLTRRTLLAGASFAAFATGPALAQIPSLLRIVVPYPAGGSTDFVARLLAESLRKDLGVTVLVDNRAGAGGRIAAEAVRTAKPDGSVLLFAPHLLFTMYPTVYQNLTYDLARDFAPVAGVYTSPYSLTIGPGVPTEVQTLAQYIAWVRADQKHAVFASPAAGGTPHFLGVMFAREIGVDMTHVPYKGGAPMMQDLLGGQIPMGFQVISDTAPNVRAGKLRSLAVSTARRSSFLPEVPTLAESGYPKLVAEDPSSLFAPAKTPKDVVQHLEAAVLQATGREAFRKALAGSYLEMFGATSVALNQRLSAETQRWSAIIKSTGFRGEE